MEENLITERQSRERADIVRPDRLQGFSDAVFATAATLLIIPIRKFELEGEETLRDALLRRWPQMLVFVLGFIVICAIWESHIIRFKVVSKIDDFIVFLTLLSLMITTFLPFTVELVGYYGKYELSIILNCFMLFCLELIEVGIFIYAFINPKLLSGRFIQLDPSEMKVKKRQIIIKATINSTLFILAALFSLLSSAVSLTLICLVTVTPLMRRIMVRLTNRCQHIHTGGNYRTSFEVLTGRIDKERIEVFSDAATAIIATLLILDLTTEDFPQKADVEKHGLQKTLENMWDMIVSYMGTYATVGFLWFVHHSILQHIKVFTPLMVLVNNVFLAFLAGTPFISTLVNNFTGRSSHNEKIAVRVSSFIVFMASLMQLLVLMLAVCRKNLTLHSWALPNSSIQHTKISHWYLAMKSCIIPTVTFITFLTSFSGDKATYYVYHVALFLVPVIFIILKVTFACHCWQQRNNQAGSPTTSIHSSISETSVSAITEATVHVSTPANTPFKSNTDLQPM